MSIGQRYSSHGSVSREDLMERRHAADIAVATHDNLVARFGEALATFCPACGTSMRERDEAGKLVCDIPGCELGRAWLVEQDRVAAINAEENAA